MQRSGIEKLLNYIRGEEMPIQIMEDNQDNIKLSPSEKMNMCTKDICMRYYLVRDITKKGTVQIIYCPTMMGTTDIWNKPLPKDQIYETRWDSRRRNTTCKAEKVC